MLSQRFGTNRKICWLSRPLFSVLWDTTIPTDSWIIIKTSLVLSLFSIRLVPLQGSPQHNMVFHFNLFPVSATLTTCMSSLTASINLLFSLPPLTRHWLSVPRFLPNMQFWVKLWFSKSPPPQNDLLQSCADKWNAGISVHVFMSVVVIDELDSCDDI